MIEISHVNKWYGPTFQVLKDCTTSVAKGEVVVVCGPSGSGKSTLIKCVNGLEPFQKGEIVVDGTRVNDPKTNLPRLRAPLIERKSEHIASIDIVIYNQNPHAVEFDNTTHGHISRNAGDGPLSTLFVRSPFP